MYGSTPLVATRVSSPTHQVVLLTVHCSHPNFKQGAAQPQAYLPQKDSSQQAYTHATSVTCTHVRYAEPMYSLEANPGNLRASACPLQDHASDACPLASHSSQAWSRHVRFINISLHEHSAAEQAGLMSMRQPHRRPWSLLHLVHAGGPVA